MKNKQIKKLEKFLSELAPDDKETVAVKERAAELELTHGMTKRAAGEKALTEHFQAPNAELRGATEVYNDARGAAWGTVGMAK